MRRKDREITDVNKIMEIIKKCDVCNLAFFDEEYPYIVPINFGATQENEKITLYFHGARIGKKLDLISKNNKVGFSMNCSHKLIIGDEACEYTMEYESVCGNGLIEIVEEAEKEEVLNNLMNQYTGMKNHKFNENALRAVTVFKLIVSQIHGKSLKRN